MAGQISGRRLLGSFIIRIVIEFSASALNVDQRVQTVPFEGYSRLHNLTEAHTEII
jgi:hypothetical protein